MSKECPSITYFLCTIGKRKMTNIVRSIYGQFIRGHDKIAVFFDGPNFAEVGPEYFQSEWDLYGEDISYTVLPQNLGFWGHGIRNLYQTTFSTDYIYNIDDDDQMIEGIIPSVRSDLATHYGKIIIYKIQARGGLIWNSPTLAYGNVGTPSGFIYNNPKIMGHWGEWYGGDYEFYRSTAEKIGMENIIFDKKIIYKVDA